MKYGVHETGDKYTEEMKHYWVQELGLIISRLMKMENRCHGTLSYNL